MTKGKVSRKGAKTQRSPDSANLLFLCVFAPLREASFLFVSFVSFVDIGENPENLWMTLPLCAPFGRSSFSVAGANQRTRLENRGSRRVRAD